jgi:hypothetical protein
MYLVEKKKRKEKKRKGTMSDDLFTSLNATGGQEDAIVAPGVREFDKSLPTRAGFRLLSRTPTATASSPPPHENYTNRPDRISSFHGRRGEHQFGSGIRVLAGLVVFGYPFRKKKSNADPADRGCSSIKQYAASLLCPQRPTSIPNLNIFHLSKS